MPYKSISELPERVRNVLPVGGQKLWMEAYNRADKDRKRFPTQSRRMEYAWGVVKKVYYKTEEGKWVRKSSSEAQAILEEFTGTDIPSSFLEWLYDHIEELQLKVADIIDILPKKFWEVKVKNALYLVPNHAKMLWEGSKKIIIKSLDLKAHIDEPLHLIENAVCYGVIRLGNSKEITIEEFDRLRDEHQITEIERKKWWPNKKVLFAYDVDWIRKFPGPLPVKIKVKGPQVFISRKNYIFKRLSSFSPMDLLYLHSYCHSGHSIDIKEFHDIVAAEMEKQGLIHPYYSWLDRDVIGLIKNYKRYNPANVSNDVLLDDHRIACAMWPAWLKRNPGKKFTSSQFKEMSRTEQIAAIRHLCRIIQTEMRKRDMKPKIKFPLTVDKKPKDLEYGDINDIDSIYVKELSDTELKDLILVLHKFYKEVDKEVVKEPVGNAHIFAWSELRARGLKYPGPKDGLYKANFSSVVEYPAPSKETKSIERLYLDDLLDALPEQFTITEPPAQIWLVGGMVNRGYCDDEDIDVLVKQDYPDMRIFRELLRNVEDEKIRDKIHPVFSGGGPEIGYSFPLYRDSYQRVPSESSLARAIEPGRAVRHLKPKSGIGKHEFFEIQDFWDKWASTRIEKGLIIEKKYDGMGFNIHYVPGKILKIITEDRARDRTDMFPKAVEELKKIKTSFVAIAEMVQYDCKGKSVRDKEALCTALPREDMIPWITVTKKKLDDSDIVFHIHELLYVDGESVPTVPHIERLKKLSSIIPKGLRHIKVVPYTLANSKASFERAVHKMRNLPGSEGVVAKQQDAVYSFSGRTSEFAKLKNLKELDVMVWQPIEKKTAEGKPLGQWVYESVFLIPSNLKGKFPEKKIVEWKGKYYYRIGKSYSTSVRCKKGDIITVRPIRIRIYDRDGKLDVTWMFPYFSSKRTDKTSPDTWTTVQRIAKAGTGTLALSTNLDPTDESIEELRGDIQKIYLTNCPYVNSDDICPLFHRIEKPWLREHSLSRVSYMRLKYPVRCKMAGIFRCPLIKNYYYEMTEPIEIRNWSLPEIESEPLGIRTLPDQSDQPCSSCTETGEL